MSEDEELKKMEQEIEAKAAEEVKAAPQPEPEPEPTPVPEAEAAPVVTEPPAAENFDPGDLGKKKGWKKPEDAIESYRQLEKEFHAKNQELNRLKEQQYVPPPNPYAAPQGYYPPPPPAYPPQQQYYPSPTEEQIAASYQTSPEDFRRVLAIARDAAAIEARKVQTEQMQWRHELERRQEKTADITGVMADPAFQNPGVREEMNEVLKSNPSLFNERRPYTAALDRALINIGRKNANGTPSGVSLPSEPPKTAGSGVASGSAPRPRVGSFPSQKQAEKMSVEDLEKTLKGAGAFRTYADM